MSELAKNSCTRCRSQKLRCSRDLPICERCKRLQAHCSYVDVRRQRRSRKTPASRLTGNEDIDTQHGNHQNLSDMNNSSMSPSSACNGIASIPSTNLDAGTSSLSPDIAQLLEDVYFEYAFNAALTIHRPTFEEDKKTGQISTHVLLSVRAVATIFLHPLYRLGQLHQDKFDKLENIQNLGLEWAREAGTLALKGIDDPSLEQMQTCENLGIYWFAAGDFKRNSMFTGICYRACRIAMLAPSRDDEKLWTQTKLETRRRCFWAAYMAACINSDHYVLGSSKDALIKKVPLPVSEASFYYAVREPLVTMNDSLDHSNTRTFDGEPSVLAEVQKLVFQWVQIRDHLEVRKTQSFKEILLDFFTLEEDLEVYQKRLHPLLVYSQDNIISQNAKGKAQFMFLLESLYQHCRLILHGSLVPYFGGRPPQEGKASSVVRSSARIALEAAQTLSIVAGDILSLEIDPACCPPLVAHTFYVAATVHATFLSRSDDLGLKAWKNLVPLLEVLTLVSPYWKSLERSSSHLVTVLQAIIRENVHSLAVPVEQSIEQLASTSPENIGPTVGHIADSVFRHSLGQAPHEKENTSQNSLSQDLLELQAHVKSFIDQNKDFSGPQPIVTEPNMTHSSLVAQQPAPGSELGWDELAWYPNMLIPSDFSFGNIFGGDSMHTSAW